MLGSDSAELRESALDVQTVGNGVHAVDLAQEAFELLDLFARTLSNTSKMEKRVHRPRFASLRACLRSLHLGPLARHPYVHDVISPAPRTSTEEGIDPSGSRRDPVDVAPRLELDAAPEERQLGLRHRRLSR